MGRFFSMITRIVLWGALGAAIGFVGVVAYQVGFTGGALGHSFSSTSAQSAAGIGFVAGGVIGFFRKN